MCKRILVSVRRCAQPILAILLFTLAFAPRFSSLALPLPGSISGQLQLQGRTNHGGIIVRAAGLSTTTQADGAFALPGLPAGAHVVEASLPGYLGARADACPVVAGATTTLSPVMLLGGDINQDATINLFDLVVLAAAFTHCPPTDPLADLVPDGCINILDVVLLGANYNLAGPLPWAVATVPDPVATASPTPTTSPSPTASPTPTASSTLTASPTSTASPTETATAAATPSATPTATLPTAPTATATLRSSTALVRIAPSCSQWDAPGEDDQNLNEEYVCLENQGGIVAYLTGWHMRDLANHYYDFPAFLLPGGAQVRIHTGWGANTATDLYWRQGSAVWNNSGDTVFLYDAGWELVHRYEYEATR